MAKLFRACAGVCGGHVAACLIFTQRLATVMLVTVPSRTTLNIAAAGSPNYCLLTNRGSSGDCRLI